MIYPKKEDGGLFDLELLKKIRSWRSKTYASEDLIKRNQKKVLSEGDILLQNIFDYKKMAIVSKKDLPAIASNNFFL